MNAPSLTSARTLARNTVWGLVGQLAPMLVAVLCIPILVKGLGVDRFGILSLAWMVVGYVSLFDLGMSRALTKLVAERLGTRSADQISPLIGTALALMTGLGALGAVAMLAATPWLASSALKIPPPLIPETRNALLLLALSVPVVIATTAFRGVLEAYQRFDLVNAIKVPMGVFNFAGPALALLVSRRLDAVVGVLVVGRLVGGWIHHALCRRAVPEYAARGLPRRELILPLLSFGGWMTVSNVISPLMVYLDRFLIGGLISMSAVAFYVTPYEIVTKLWLVPGALAGVLFPAFAASLAVDRKRADLLLDRGQRYVFLSMFPVIVAVVALAQLGLDLWLGPEFARHSTRVLQWLAIGVFVNSMAHLPFAFIQGSGRPDLTAKLHLVELPAYLLLLWWAVPRFGIEGAAAVWVARMTFDTGVLHLLAKWFVTDGRVLRRSLVTTGVAVAVLIAANFPGGALAKVGFLAVVYAVFLPVGWSSILGAEERAVARARLRALAGVR